MKFVRIVEANSRKTYIRRINKSNFIKYNGENIPLMPGYILHNSHWPYRVLIIMKNKQLFMPHPSFTQKFFDSQFKLNMEK